MVSREVRLAATPVAVTVALVGVLASLRRTLSWTSAASLIKFLLQGWKSLPEEVRKYISGSFLVSAPIALLGAVGGIQYKLFSMSADRIRYYLYKYCQCTLVFSNSDEHYESIIDYIGNKCRVDTGRKIASTKPRSRPSFQEMLAYWLGGKLKAPTLYLQPELQGFADSFYWQDADGVTHKIWICRSVEKPQFVSGDQEGRKDPETLSLTMWWTTDYSVLRKFIEAGLKASIKEEGEGQVDIYVRHQWIRSMWTKAITRERRDRDTVILDEGDADYVVEDMRNFFSEKTADWYHNAGIPYRRGYLLFGPPGCGKTSFAQVLAGELRLDLCLMNLSNTDMNDDDLAELLRSAPSKSMLLLEDVDAIFVERAAADEKKGRGGISFSGLLNALDGAAAQEGCVIMMTTNHKEKLDEALIRPGRCDVHVKVDKASKDQAKRMFWRFFSKEPTVKSIPTAGEIVTTAEHRLITGDRVKVRAGLGKHMKVQGRDVEDYSTFFVRSLDATRLSLYNTEESARAGGTLGFVEVSEGKGSKLQEITEIGVRFSNRIPERQVSMAKLQGYLMKQKLLAEKAVSSRRTSMGGILDTTDASFTDEVHDMAAEQSWMMVHELLDVKQDVEEVKTTIYDHFRRLGLHHFACIFEHYGIRLKEDITEDVKTRMEQWEPDLKVDGPHKSRLKRLLSGEESLNEHYRLADLSVLRDRFLSTFQKLQKQRDALGPSALAALPPPPPEALVRSVSEPWGTDAKTTNSKRRELLRSSSGIREEPALDLINMAHSFQEKLETNGKTDVSLWQLDMHFQRYADDPVAALENCEKLIKPSATRLPEECRVKWMATFPFLRRIGLESYAFTLEDAGFKLWREFKDLSKDTLKEKGGFSDDEASLCVAILTNDDKRPDLMRKFAIPEFGDTMALFRNRFPHSKPSDARQFAVQITDELGVGEFSYHQLETYLSGAKSPAQALENIEEGLPTNEKAEAARKRPEPPPPAAEPTNWVYTWLKPHELHCYADAFLGQALTSKEDIVGAPLDHKILEGMDIKKIGHRCKLLRLVEELKSTAASGQEACSEVLQK